MPHKISPGWEPLFETGECGCCGDSRDWSRQGLPMAPTVTVCRVETRELLGDSICAVNTFQNCIGSPAFLLQRLQSTSVFPSVYSTSPLYWKRRRRLRDPQGFERPLTCRAGSPNCKRPGPLCSLALAWAPGASAVLLLLHLPTRPCRPPVPQTLAPPLTGGSEEAAGVDANQRSQPRTAVAPRLTHSPKLNTHYTKLIDIN